MPKLPKLPYLLSLVQATSEIPAATHGVANTQHANVGGDAVNGAKTRPAPFSAIFRVRVSCCRTECSREVGGRVGGRCLCGSAGGRVSTRLTVQRADIQVDTRECPCCRRINLNHSIAGIAASFFLQVQPYPHSNIAHSTIPCSWPTSVISCLPSSALHSMTVLSAEHDAIHRPFGLYLAAETDL